jgi:hypothetical protein
MGLRGVSVSPLIITERLVYASVAAQSRWIERMPTVQNVSNCDGAHTRRENLAERQQVISVSSGEDDDQDNDQCLPLDQKAKPVINRN